MAKKADLIGSHFPTIYLTIISLLQGIALSQVVPIIITYFEIAEHPWTSIQLLPMLIMLFIIFVVWHHYAMGIFFLRWFPNIIDTLIPFMISIGQFFLISFLVIKTSISEIDVETWTIGFASIMVTGALPYYAASKRLEPDLFTNIMSRPNAVIHCRLTGKYHNLAGSFVLFQGLFAIVIVITQIEILLWLSFLFLIAHIILSEYLVLKTIKPHFVKSLDEFDKE